MNATERLVIDLPVDLVEGLRDSIKSGAFASESEAIEMLLRLWYGHEQVEEPDSATLRAFVAEGIADADAGRLVDSEEMFKRLRARFSAIAAKRAGG
jgi:antitoxin ParD1/3/4